MLQWVVVLGLGAGCASHRASVDAPFVWEANVQVGDVRVLPGLFVHDALTAERADYVGDDLSETRLAVREQRAADLNLLPLAVGLSLPGALHKELGTRWSGDFHAAEWPDAVRVRLERAVERGTGVDAALGPVAKAVGGQAVLVTWVDRLAASPLSMRAFPGDMVATSQGMVLVDHVDEPFLVDLRVGMALVSADGRVLIRYRDEVQSLLSGARPPDLVGRDVAQQVAHEVAKVWGVGSL